MSPDTISSVPPAPPASDPEVSEKLLDAASRVRSKATRAAHATANTLNHTAEYIRKHDAASMLSDAKRLAKDNPGLTLLGGAIIGFVLAKLWTRD